MFRKLCLLIIATLAASALGLPAKEANSTALDITKRDVECSINYGQVPEQSDDLNITQIGCAQIDVKWVYEKGNQCGYQYVLKDLIEKKDETSEVETGAACTSLGCRVQGRVSLCRTSDAKTVAKNSDIAYVLYHTFTVCPLQGEAQLQASQFWTNLGWSVLTDYCTGY